MKKIFLLLTIAGVPFIMFGQYISGVTIPDSNMVVELDPALPAVKIASTITAEDLEAHLTYLAADNLQGREAGSEGIDKAAVYISEHFESLGLDPTGTENSYYQNVAFSWTRWEKDGVLLTINDSTYKHLHDYLCFPNNNENREIDTDEIVFLGYGIDEKRYSDYKKNDVTDKVILIYDGEPVNKDGISQITKTKDLSDWSIGFKKKLMTAKKYGVREVLIIPNDFRSFVSENRKKVLRFVMELGDPTMEGSSYANATFISSNIARDIMGDKLKKVIKSRDRSKKKGKACDVSLPVSFNSKKQRDQRTLIGKNVLGFIEGTDKKDEIIVVSAHYDHVGFRGDDIYNGANDNGSGTVTVMEIAEALALAKEMGYRPRRSILCLLVTAEEKGLLGSEYYSEFPVFPLENTICNINIDMVGRTDMKYADTPNYIYVIGSDRLSSDLHKINESVNEKYARMILDYTYNDENDANRYYYRSDHYNFAKKGIPAIFFFNGVHKDYHRSTDTIEKMNFGLMRETARLIFHTCWEVANREERLKVDGEIR